MDRPGHNESVRFFIGKEVEHTPAYGKKTLFVVGVQPYDEIMTLCNINNIDHIYLGANQSFDIEDQEDFEAWQNLICNICEINEGKYWVTLDYDVQQHHRVTEMNIFRLPKLIPMISC